MVFVKFPVPGRVKTRLAATVGAERAAEIYRAMVEIVFRKLPADFDVIVCFDPEVRRMEMGEWVSGLLPRRAVHFLAQCEGDLGLRLERAFTDVFALGFQEVAVIGTDCLDLDAAIFHETWAALADHDVVLGPSEDGGYYLIALTAPRPSLFAAIPWSTERVLVETQARAAAAGVRVHLLPTRFDVDTEEDWRRAEEKLNLPR